MTDSSKAQSAATHTAVPLPQKRGRRLLLVLVTALSGVSLSSVSLAASSQPHQKHETVSAPPRQAASQRPPAKKAAAKPGSHAGERAAAHATPSKSKRPEALQPTTHRKAPVNARTASKSKTPKRTHQSASKPTKTAAKQPKPVA